jgi:hypothetical protein
MFCTCIVQFECNWEGKISSKLKVQYGIENGFKYHISYGHLKIWDIIYIEIENVPWNPWNLRFWCKSHGDLQHGKDWFLLWIWAMESLIWDMATSWTEINSNCTNHLLCLICAKWCEQEMKMKHFMLESYLGAPMPPSCHEELGNILKT